MAKVFKFKVTNHKTKRTKIVEIEADSMAEAMDELDPAEGSEVDIESVTNAKSDTDDGTNVDSGNSGNDSEAGGDNDSTGEVEIISVELADDDDGDSADSDDGDESSETSDEGDESESANDHVDTGDSDEAPEKGHWWDGDWDRRRKRKGGE